MVFLCALTERRRAAAWHLESRPGGDTIKIQGRLSGGLAGDAAPLLTLNDGQSVRGKMEFRGEVRGRTQQGP